MPAEHNFLMWYTCQAICSSLKFPMVIKTAGSSLNLQYIKILSEQLVMVN